MSTTSDWWHEHGGIWLKLSREPNAARLWYLETQAQPRFDAAWAAEKEPDTSSRDD